MRIILPILLFLILLFDVLHATGGAWNRARGGYYIKLGVDWQSAEDEYDRWGHLRRIVTDSTRFSENTFSSTDVAIYAEYGVSSWLTATLSSQVKFLERISRSIATRRDTTTSAFGLGDLWLGARLRLLPEEETFVAAATFSLKLPTAATDADIPLGDGALDYEGSLAVGSPWHLADLMSGYAQLSAGYRIRGAASREYNYLAEIGISPWGSLIIQAAYEGTHSGADFSGTLSAISAGTAPDAGDQSFTRWRAGIIYSLSEEMELNAGYGGVVSGRMTLALSGVSVGIAWKQ